MHSKPSKPQPYKTYELSSVDRSTEIQEMEATRMYQKLIHKTRVIKLGAACAVLAEWSGWREKGTELSNICQQGACRQGVAWDVKRVFQVLRACIPILLWGKRAPLPVPFISMGSSSIQGACNHHYSLLGSPEAGKLTESSGTPEPTWLELFNTFPFVNSTPSSSEPHLHQAVHTLLSTQRSGHSGFHPVSNL